jgi:hypothetical protein
MRSRCCCGPRGTHTVYRLVEGGKVMCGVYEVDGCGGTMGCRRSLCLGKSLGFQSGNAR